MGKKMDLLKRLVKGAVIGLVFAGCLAQESTPTPIAVRFVTVTPGAPADSVPTDESQSFFTDVAAEVGAKLRHQGIVMGMMPMGAGAAFSDYNNDGWLDIYVTNQGGPNALYRNNGDGTFTDQAAAARVAPANTMGSGALFADYDNDGWRDLYVVNLGQNLLYHNNGDGTFTDVTGLAGVGDAGAGLSAAWSDYDNDGWLDLYVVNHVGPSGSADRLYHNQGDGTFSDVSSLLPARLRSGAGFVAGFVDYDDDGDQDLYLVNDNTFGEHRANVLWLNEGPGPDGEWLFRDVSTRSRSNISLNGMGLAVADFNNDTYQDFAIANIGANALLANTGRGQFQDVSRQAGIERPLLSDNREALTWCTLSLDYDNDGWLDLFMCGSPLDKGDGQPSALFHNRQDGTFEDVSPLSGISGEHWTRVGAWGDYDGDGDVDLFVTNYDESTALYRNNSQGAHWLTVRLTGTQSNRDGIGAKLRLTAGDQTQLRQIQSGGSKGGGNDIAAYFGLGQATQVDRLEIEWPSGAIQTLTNLSGNQMLTVTEAPTSNAAYDLRLEALNLPDAGFIPCGQVFDPKVQVWNLGQQPLRSGSLTVSVATTLGESILDETVDLPELSPSEAQMVSLPGWIPEAGMGYQLQVVGQLPADEYAANNTLETILQATIFSDVAFDIRLVEEEPGSGVVSGDFNGDGYTDLYLVNSGRPNLLYLNRGDGIFADATATAAVGHPGLGSTALAADFDQDGDLDIYLLNVDEANVFYRNRGDATFEEVTTTGLNHQGTSRAAVSGDFDRDGDLDIYLVNDGQANLLYLNQGDGAFEPAPDTAGLTDRESARSVTSGDFDNDGDLDLYLVKDRQANVLYLNQGNGTFVIAPPEAGVSDRGRGQAAVAADFDSDGDLDLYLVNLTQANSLYLNQGNGAFQDGTASLGLGADKGASTWAVGADFNSDGHLDLAVANTGEQANSFYANDGNGHFRPTTPASGIGQATNSVALVTDDFNNDGSPDLYVVNANLPDQLYLNNHPNGAECW